MTVQERLGSIMAHDQFPVGMRVLAVDNDPTCLSLLDTLLRRCQYHVTTTNQAIMALNMLRENKNKFDLVISEVHMPDMDGFKLLEHVGLEMELPVIMLSANSDPKLVMKGITHGACDYLLKPVRIEELKNIWQHAIRKKKFNSEDHNNSYNQDNPHHGTGEGGQGPTATENADRNGKFNRNRKDQNEDVDEVFEESEHENTEPSTQRKPRVVWSMDLHRKFVAAVNRLGIDKAVPKRILDLMNVDGLTRENVASHLQKYRLYLKRINHLASHQANMVANLGGKDSSNLYMGSMDGLGDFHSFAGPGQLPNTALSSFPPGGMLGRLNTPAGISNAFCNRKMDATMIGQSNCGAPFLMKHTEVEKSDAETTIKLEEYLLEDLMSAKVKQVDAVISQAQATLGALLQSLTFGGISSKHSDVSNCLPMVNHSLSAIKRKKSMDTIIVSLVASVCTFLILVYWLTK